MSTVTDDTTDDMERMVAEQESYDLSSGQWRDLEDEMNLVQPDTRHTFLRGAAPLPVDNPQVGSAVQEERQMRLWNLASHGATPSARLTWLVRGWRWCAQRLGW